MSKDQFALLNQPKTVLYLKRADHINDPMTRQHLLDFVSNHIVTFGDEKAYRAKNILFAVATIPNDMEYSDWREIADRFVSIVDLSQI